MVAIFYFNFNERKHDNYFQTGLFLIEERSNCGSGNFIGDKLSWRDIPLKFESSEKLPIGSFSFETTEMFDNFLY